MPVQKRYRNLPRQKRGAFEGPLRRLVTRLVTRGPTSTRLPRSERGFISAKPCTFFRNSL